MLVVAAVPPSLFMTIPFPRHYEKVLLPLGSVTSEEIIWKCWFLYECCKPFLISISVRMNRLISGNWLVSKPKTKRAVCKLEPAVFIGKRASRSHCRFLQFLWPKVWRNTPNSKTSLFKSTFYCHPVLSSRPFASKRKFLRGGPLTLAPLSGHFTNPHANDVPWRYSIFMRGSCLLLS